MMGWFYVFLAAASELVGVIGLKKYSHQKRQAAVFYIWPALAEGLHFYILPSTTCK